MKIFIYLLIILFTSQINATNLGESTGYKIPRFVSLKSNDVNLRVGPSKNYPIKIKYIQENFPVEIFNEYDVWRQVRDIEGNIGWIHQSLLKGDRYGIIKLKSKKESNLFSFPEGSIIGLIGARNIVKIKKCLVKWCLINYKIHNGWIKKNNLWGVYEKEIYKIGFFQPIINFYWKIKLKSKQLSTEYFN